MASSPKFEIESLVRRHGWNNPTIKRRKLKDGDKVEIILETGDGMSICSEGKGEEKEAESLAWQSMLKGVYMIQKKKSEEKEKQRIKELIKEALEDNHQQKLKLNEILSYLNNLPN